MHKLARQKHILDRLSETGQLSISELVAELRGVGSIPFAAI